MLCDEESPLSCVTRIADCFMWWIFCLFVCLFVFSMGESWLPQILSWQFYKSGKSHFCWWPVLPDDGVVVRWHECFAEMSMLSCWFFCNTGRNLPWFLLHVRWLTMQRVNEILTWNLVNCLLTLTFIIDWALNVSSLLEVVACFKAVGGAPRYTSWVLSVFPTFRAWVQGVVGSV